MPFSKVTAFSPVPQPTSPTESRFLNEPLVFDHLTLQDGLSESTVLDLLQDELGFMWFATQNGLDKYDGYNFTVYTHDPGDANSLSNNTVRGLMLGQDGSLWVGTLGGGLDRLDRRTGRFTHYRHSDTEPNSLSNNVIRALYEDQAGQVWVGTEVGLNRLDPATGLITHYLSGEIVGTLSGAATTGLWAGTDSGLYLLDPSTGATRHFQHLPDDLHSLSHDSVQALLLTRDHTLWVGTKQGINKFDPTTETFTHYHPVAGQPTSLSAEGVLVLSEDHAGNIWVGTREGGLNRFDRVTETFTRYVNDPTNPQSLSGDTIIAIKEDRSGILWVGTFGANLNFFDPFRRKLPPPISIPTPLAIQAGTEHSLWIGTFEDGLFHLSSEGQIIFQYQHDPANAQSLASDQIYALAWDPAGVLWVGTSSGLDRFDPQTQVFTHDPVEVLSDSLVRALLVDRQGDLWIGTANGLNQLDLATGEMRQYFPDPNQADSLSHKNVQLLYQDAQGILWIGTRDGLNRFDPITTSFQRYLQTGGDAANTNLITTMHPAPDQKLWVGTWGNGLLLFDPATGAATAYRKSEGLPDEVILGLLEDDDGYLWISTSNGLARFDPTTHVFRNYDQSDGLLDKAFDQGAYFRNAAGELFFGSGPGLIRFDPRTIHDNPHLPNVVLTDLQIFNRSVGLGGDSPLAQLPNYVTDLTLSYQQSVFSFEFVALGFTNAQKNQYAYKMEGFDPDWNTVGTRRFATYTNLDPGTYTFRVKASNNDGVWNEDGLRIQVTITPPWWRTWWAYTLYAVFGLGLVLAYGQYRTRAQTRELAAQHRELAHERRLRGVLEQAENLKEADRARIAREMHDGLAQTLAGLRFRARTWKTLLEENPVSLRPELDDLNKALDESIEEVRRSIFALRPPSLDEMGFYPALEQLAENFTRYYQVQAQLNLSAATQPLPEALENALFRMIQELLHNAARHAQATQIWVTVEVQPERVRLEVRDNGMGFDTTQLEERVQAGHFGLAQLRERVAYLNGTVVIDSAPGQGATIRVVLPIA